MKIIKISAEWCGPCKVLEHNLNTLNVDHTTIDVDTDVKEELEILEKYPVRNVPTMLFFDDNDVFIDKVIGSLGRADLQSRIDEIKSKIKNNETNKA